MKKASCPSCGAPVAFRSATSLYVVCDFCRSTLLRSGEDLQNLGRMAELLEDSSPIQIGSEGTFRSRHFLVIGRIQMKYEAGIWNEWHILFDDGRGAWLAEAAGEWIVSAQVAVADPLPAFETLAPDLPVTLDGRSFRVADLETARCIAGQGELPFKVAAGYDVNTADLRGNGRYVTLDYSETPPLVFVGQTVSFADLKLEKLREQGDPTGGEAPTVDARAFNCPRCAAPLRIHSPAIESIACDSCGSLIGVENQDFRLLAGAAQALREIPWLPLGSQGTLRGVNWEVIGFMRRRTTSEGTDYLVGIPAVQCAAGLCLADRVPGTLEPCAHALQPAISRPRAARLLARPSEVQAVQQRPGRSHLRRRRVLLAGCRRRDLPDRRLCLSAPAALARGHGKGSKLVAIRIPGTR
ncbi:MAG: DUF4178 domain-containing protein [Candidatus Accumulibacter sp.]|nr:DUF4178 domain-containing protein [Candidatus Accumulibacter propinquus]